MYKEYFVQGLIDKILSMEPGDELTFCERYDEADAQDVTCHASWYGIYVTVVADNLVAIIGKYGMGDVGLITLEADDAREQMIRYFNDRDHRIYHKLLVEEDVENDQSRQGA